MLNPNKQTNKHFVWSVQNHNFARNAKAYRHYADFLYRARLLTNRFLEQGQVATRLQSSLQRFYGRQHELLDRKGVSVCAMKADLFNVSQFSFPLSSTPDLTFYEQLGGCFQKSRGPLPYRCTWFMLPVFSGIRVVHLLLLLCIYDFSSLMFFVVYVFFQCLAFFLFPMTGLCPWITLL